MLKRTIEVSIPLKHVTVLVSPDPNIVLSYLQNIGTRDSRFDGIFDFQLLFPSRKNGGTTENAIILEAKVFINGNSGVGKYTSQFEGVLHSLGGAIFGTNHRPQVWIDVLAGKDGGYYVGECMFEVPIDTLPPLIHLKKAA